MRYRRGFFVLLVAVLAFLGIRLLAGDEDDAPPPAAEPTAVLPTIPTTSTVVPPTTTAAPTTEPTAVVPDVVGKRLTAAIADLAGAGYTDVLPVDGAGDRVPVNPENWLVRGQEPAAGTAGPPTTRVRLTVEKPSESPAPGPGGVPEVVCTELPQARAALAAAGYATELTDGSGQGRLVLVESNWLVIGQRLTGRTVVLTVVKYGEPTGSAGCPS